MDLILNAPVARRRPRSALAALLTVFLLSACADRTPTSIEPPLEPSDEPVLYLDSLAGPYHLNARIDCNVTVAPPAITCGSIQAPAGVVSPQIGGRGVHTRLLTSNVGFNTTSREFRADVAVQNLLVNQIGTRSGAITGITPFVWGGPSNGVAFLNHDGTAFFTAANQRYFHYPEKVGMLGSTTPKQWRLSVPVGVSSFVFRIYVSAEIMPVVVFDGVSPSGNRDIYRIAADGTDLVQLTSASTEEVDPTAARNTVVFTRYIGGKASLWSVPLEGGPMQQLLSIPGDATQPALNQAGSWLAFLRDVSGVNRVWTTLVAGAYMEPLTWAEPFREVIESSPAWDPTHVNRAAFVSTAGAKPGIYRRFVAKTAATQALAASNGTNVDPGFNREGTLVVFSSDRRFGDPEIHVRPNTPDPGATVTRLTGVATGTSDVQPSFLSDGNVVFVRSVSGLPRLRKYTFETNANELILGPGILPANPYGVPLWP